MLSTIGRSPLASPALRRAVSTSGNAFPFPRSPSHLAPPALSPMGLPRSSDYLSAVDASPSSMAFAIPPTTPSSIQLKLPDTRPKQPPADAKKKNNKRMRRVQFKIDLPLPTDFLSELSSKMARLVDSRSGEFKSVKGRVPTPYPEKKEWLEDD